MVQIFFSIWMFHVKYNLGVYRCCVVIYIIFIKSQADQLITCNKPVPILEKYQQPNSAYLDTDIA